MQGRLRKEPLVVHIHTACAHCGTELVFSMNSALEYALLDVHASPLVFIPDVNWASFAEANILDAF